jgi:hypothetical protein
MVSASGKISFPANEERLAKEARLLGDTESTGARCHEQIEKQ